MGFVCISHCYFTLLKNEMKLGRDFVSYCFCSVPSLKFVQANKIAAKICLFSVLSTLNP
jgi:hypothetical protein